MLGREWKCLLVILFMVQSTWAGKGIEALGESLGVIETIGTGMQSAHQIPTTKQKMTAQFGKARQKMDSIDEDAHEEAGEAVEGAATGLQTLVTGIQTGSWQDMISGGLELCSAVTSMIEVPAVLGALLTITSICFSLFGGSTGGEESTESLIENAINAALAKTKSEELKAEANGLKNIVGTLTRSIKNFRKAETISDAQTQEFYGLTFEGLPFFGKLKHYMKKFCVDVEDIEAVEDDEEKKKKINEDVNKCLEFCNLYADLSILRQLFNTDLASLLSEVGKNAASENVLMLIKNERKADREDFKFLVDPVNYQEKRYIVAQCYSHIENYPTLMAYIDRLDKDMIAENVEKRNHIAHFYGNKKNTRHNLANTTDAVARSTEIIAEGYIKDSIMFCAKNCLTGDCLEKPGVMDLKTADLSGWNNKITSLYVSKRYKVTAFENDDYKGTQYGPYYGPAAYCRIFGEKSWSSVKIETTDRDSSKFLRICDMENTNPDGDCDLLDYGEYPDLSKINGGDISTVDGNAEGATCVFPFKYDSKLYHQCTMASAKKLWCATTSDYDSDKTYGYCKFGRDWNDKIESISIPAGMMVTGYNDKNFVSDKVWGPLYGPDTINRVCFVNQWSSMKVEETKMSSTTMVRICRGKDFQSYCDSLEVPELAGNMKPYSKLDYSNKDLHGCNWDDDRYKFKSMKIPRGVRVEIFSEPDFGGMPYGPFTGPISIPSVDGTGESKRIRSMKIHKVF